MGMWDWQTLTWTKLVCTCNGLLFMQMLCVSVSWYSIIFQIILFLFCSLVEVTVSVSLWSVKCENDPFLWVFYRKGKTPILREETIIWERTIMSLVEFHPDKVPFFITWILLLILFFLDNLGISLISDKAAWWNYLSRKIRPPKLCPTMCSLQASFQKPWEHEFGLK